MEKTSKSEYAILGLLALGPKSGYDLKKAADEMLSHFWHESYGQIYPVLQKLDRRGWIKRRAEGRNSRPGRQSFAITADGRKALRRWLDKPARAARPRNELLLKIFLGRQTDYENLADHVTRHRQESVARVRLLESLLARLDIEQAGNLDYPFWRITARRDLHSRRATIAWCDETLVELENLRRSSRSAR